MNKRAQASLEYLLMYGWALVLIAAVIGVLAFIIVTPRAEISFRTNSMRFLVKAGQVVEGGGPDSVILVVQNATATRIQVTSIETEGDILNNAGNDLALNGESQFPVEVIAGSNMYFENLDTPVDGLVRGQLVVYYTDGFNIDRTLVITASRIGGGGGNGGGNGNGNGTPPACVPGGDGSFGNPFIICDVAGLQAINDNTSAYYQLGDNIDAGETSAWNGGQGFMPLGPSGNRFSGSFDGQSHTITGLYINRPAGVEQGLFVYATSTAEIKDLVLSNFDITAGMFAAGLVADNAGTITNVSVQNVDVTATTVAGGLASSNRGAISNSSSTGSVFSTLIAGGLAGINSGTVAASYSASQVTGSGQVGGLVGDNSGTVTNSYASGNVNGNDSVGGLIGRQSLGTTSNSYAYGSVTGSTNTGGLVGSDNTGTGCSDSFWDTQTTGQAASDCSASGKTTAEMYQQETFDPPWDFAAVWSISQGSDYPRLQWE